MMKAKTVNTHGYTSCSS